MAKVKGPDLSRFDKDVLRVMKKRTEFVNLWLAGQLKETP